MANNDEQESEENRKYILEIAREEAHRTIDKQFETLDDIDNKAAKILRLNLLLLSIILTGFSVIAADNGTDSMMTGPGIPNQYLILGILSIIASTSVAAFTYTASNKKGGMSGRDIADLLDSDYSAETDLKDIVEGYSFWMQMNFRTNTVNAPLVTGVLLLLIYGIILVAVGVYHAFVHPAGITMTIAVMVVISLITWRSGIANQIQRYLRYRNFTPGKD